MMLADETTDGYDNPDFDGADLSPRDSLAPGFFLLITKLAAQSILKTKVISRQLKPLL